MAKSLVSSTSHWLCVCVCAPLGASTLTKPPLLPLNRYVDGKGSRHTLSGIVVIATGGFGADFTDDSLLSTVEQEWRTLDAWQGVPLPPLRSLPTTNGPHCTGDGVKMTGAIGAGTVHLKYVQVHPTGIVDPKDPSAKVKFLAAEALRGSGGLLLDAKGQRFADELGKRDYVSGRMWKHGKPPYRLILNTAASKQVRARVEPPPCTSTRVICH